MKAMKKMPIFPFVIDSVSMLVNLYPVFSHSGTNVYNSMSLILSTNAWFSYLFCLYCLGTKPAKPGLLKGLGLLLVATMLFPLYDVLSHSSENVQNIVTGFLPAIYVLLNYLSRISLIAFGIGVLVKSAKTIRFTIAFISVLVVISFLCTGYEMAKIAPIISNLDFFPLLSKLLDPFAIGSFLILHFYILKNIQTNKHSN